VPTALDHPTNEDLFAGTPGSGDHFVVGIPVWAIWMVAVLPLVGIMIFPGRLCFYEAQLDRSFMRWILLTPQKTTNLTR
jgi:hypothetical protein